MCNDWKVKDAQLRRKLLELPPDGCAMKMEAHAPKEFNVMPDGTNVTFLTDDNTTIPAFVEKVNADNAVTAWLSLGDIKTEYVYVKFG